jgi:amino acid transporter
VAVLYLAINLSVIGVVPWREFVPADARPNAQFVVSIFMERVYGSTVASVFTLMILWTAFGSVFALLLGYSRIPYAAARDGYFFEPFGRLHPTKGFPHVSLIVLGGVSILSSFVSLGVVIDALIATRIVVQFMGQIAGVVLLRRRAPEMARPFRIWLYPVPVVIAFVGWVFIFSTSGALVILFGLGVLALGLLCFLAWSLQLRQWAVSWSSIVSDRPAWRVAVLGLGHWYSAFGLARGAAGVSEGRARRGRLGQRAAVGGVHPHVRCEGLPRLRRAAGARAHRHRAPRGALSRSSPT